MRYVTESDVDRCGFRGIIDAVSNISKSGSVLGMQKQYGWPKGGQVRIGGYIYNVGTSVVEAMRNANIVRGE